MRGGYHFIVASLPHLKLFAIPPLTSGQFLSLCAEHVPAAHCRVLNEVELFQVQPAPTALALLDRWHERERSLRNALAVVRAKRLGEDATPHLRNFRHDRELAEVAGYILSFDSPLATDEELDRVRWRFLEELTFGHYFDLETLVIYMLKLEMLERHARFNTTTGTALLDRIVAQGAERGREAFTVARN